MNLLPYTAGRVFNTPLMVSRAKLDTILNVVVPRMDGEKLPIAAPPEKHEYGISKEGIAVIPVIGTLVRRTVGLEAQSGLTSYVGLEAQLDAALNDNSIKGILLDIDSPGGEAGGVFGQVAAGVLVHQQSRQLGHRLVVQLDERCRHVGAGVVRRGVRVQRHL